MTVKEKFALLSILVTAGVGTAGSGYADEPNHAIINDTKPVAWQDDTQISHPTDEIMRSTVSSKFEKVLKTIKTTQNFN